MKKLAILDLLQSLIRMRPPFKWAFRNNPLCVICVVVLLVVMTACSKWQPGYFDKPTKTEVHGRITEKTYYSGDYFNVLEVDGTPIRFPDGYVEFTKYCEVEGIDAVVFTVRGKPGAPGIFVLQAHGDEPILERLCDYRSSFGSWDGAVIHPCDTGWDASKRKRVTR